MIAFVHLQGLSIQADRPALLQLLIHPLHQHATGLLSGVMLFFVNRQDLSVLAVRPAWPLLAILADHVYVTGLLP